MLKRTVLALLSALAFCGAPLFMPQDVAAQEVSENIGGSGAELVAEVNSGRVLYEYNADDRLPMASTTKILTALIVIEDCDPDAVVTVPPECVGVEGSSVYLTAGEKIKVKDLLYGLMLRSGNDCAETLAVYHSGTVDRFAVYMNERAFALGATGSRFKNPHGLPDPEHYTTARDLAVIACAAMKNETFKEIVSARSAVVPDGGCGYARELVNKNKMLYRYEGANGIKTGYTKAAGRCLVAAAEREGMQLVSVVLNCPDMYERSGALLDAAFGAYSYKRVFDSSAYKITADTEVGGKTCAGACAEDFSYPLADGEDKDVRIVAECRAPLVLPVESGDELGILRIYLKKQLLFSQKIYSIESVKKSWADILGELSRNFTRQEDLCGSINISPNAAWRAGVPAIN